MREVSIIGVDLAKQVFQLAEHLKMLTKLFMNETTAPCSVLVGDEQRRAIFGPLRAMTGRGAGQTHLVWCSPTHPTARARTQSDPAGLCRRPAAGWLCPGGIAVARPQTRARHRHGFRLRPQPRPGAGLLARHRRRQGRGTRVVGFSYLPPFLRYTTTAAK